MIHDDSWWFMMIHDDSWWLMMIHDDSWWFVIIHDHSWLFMMCHENSWCLMIIHHESKQTAAVGGDPTPSAFPRLLLLRGGGPRRAATGGGIPPPSPKACCCYVSPGTTIRIRLQASFPYMVSPSVWRAWNLNKNGSWDTDFHLGHISGG